MNETEDRRTGLPPCKAAPCMEPGNKTKPERRPEQQDTPDSPGPESSCLSMKSDTSLQHFIDFKRNPEQQDPLESPGPECSCLSMKSDASLQNFTDFKRSPGQQNKPDPLGSEPCCRRRMSKENPLVSRRSAEMSPEQLDCPESELMSMMSKENPLTFRKSAEMRVIQEDSEVLSTHLPQQDSVLMMLEDDIVTFVKNELKKIPKFLSSDYPESLGREREEEVVLDMEEEKERRRIREAFLQISVHYLKKRNQMEVAETLQSRYPVPVCFQQKLKSHLKEKFQCVFQGISKAGTMTPLNQIYTELYITEGEPGEVNNEHEVTQIESVSRKPERLEKPITHEDIFTPPSERERPIRTVMTKGVAGIGKTVLTQKFALDWAEDRSNQDIQFTFPFTFRELNLVKDKTFSLVKLIHHFFTEVKEAEICRLEHFPVVFIFDGLDECRLRLDFHGNQIVTDVTKSATVDALLTSLIRGKLLPSARLWITSRPAAADQILPEYVDMVTEVRGFTDPQKEEYFRKRFPDEDQANRIVSHIKTSRSLHIMCHIPIFCWITATVLENVLRSAEEAELPRTLTDMYIRFLVVQSEVKNARNYGGAKTDSQSKESQNKGMIESLGKLAFEHLQIGNLIFYESDLRESGIDVTEASVYSGLLTQIFIEETGLFQDKVFCFVHLSVQEFLAAFYIHLTFVKSGINLLSEKQKCDSAKPTQIEFYRTAVDKALESTNGKFDLFLRFLLGLSMQTSQALLRGLLKQTESSSQTNEDTVQYIKHKISQSLSQEKSINLFHCLNELKDSSLVEEIQKYLRAGNLSPDKLSPAQWSALVFILLSSEKDLDVFDMKKYCDSEEALLRLLPVVRAANKAILSGCNLSGRSCEALASVLSSQSCSLRELDLSNNNLWDSGVMLLCEGLRSPHCTLKTLRLSGCLITVEGCSALASALRSNPSHLKELDLSYNHPGESGVELLSALQQDAGVRLSTLRVEPAGVQWLKPGLEKYFLDLTLDTNTVNAKIRLSDDNRLMSHVDEDQKYPSHEDRFDHWPQLLSRDGLTGRCYWEVEWNGRSHIAVTYRGINRRGNGYDCLFGRNDQSWSLVCSDTIGYSFWHDNKATYITVSAASSASDRVAVYLDWPAGTLSFYRVSSDTMIHLHTCTTKFSEPLFPGFRFWSDRPGSTIRLCSPKERFSFVKGN